jgi:predicted nucleic acid-binding protein
MKAGATKRLVLDASLTLAWCFEDESTAYTEAVLDLLANGAEAVVPSVWPLEVANALLVGEKRKRITLAQVTAALERIGDLPISIDPMRVDRAFGPILLLARKEQLSEYDAAYLDLALREGLPLATLDNKLRNTAQSAGIALAKV